MQPDFDTNMKTTDLQTLTNLFDGEIYLPVEPLDPNMPLQYSGSMDKGILMLLPQKLDTADLDQLQKICTFLKLEMKEVAIANVNEQTITKEKIAELKTLKLICWGIDPSTYFNCGSDLYTPMEIDGIKIIYTATLAQISIDSASKKVLASALLIMFS
ncbi:MAG: hypothetical protein SGJ10_00365 [Bacteroidota bacterium]|nr:hypothetical protein [Bacteroidota bacterium]